MFSPYFSTYIFHFRIMNIFPQPPLLMSQASINHILYYPVVSFVCPFFERGCGSIV